MQDSSGSWGGCLVFSTSSPGSSSTALSGQLTESRCIDSVYHKKDYGDLNGLTDVVQTLAVGVAIWFYAHPQQIAAAQHPLVSPQTV